MAKLKLVGQINMHSRPQHFAFQSNDYLHHLCDVLCDYSESHATRFRPCCERKKLRALRSLRLCKLFGFSTAQHGLALEVWKLKKAVKSVRLHTPPGHSFPSLQITPAEFIRDLRASSSPMETSSPFH